MDIGIHIKWYMYHFYLSGEVTFTVSRTTLKSLERNDVTERTEVIWADVL